MTKPIARETVVPVPLALAQFVRKVFLPTNPNKMRTAAPETREAAWQFIRLVMSGGIAAGEKNGPDLMEIRDQCVEGLRATHDCPAVFALAFILGEIGVPPTAREIHAAAMHLAQHRGARWTGKALCACGKNLDFQSGPCGKPECPVKPPLSLADAVLAYDSAIQACANDPAKMASFCSAEGEDLDAMYLNMVTAAREAR